jgi:hypothetical protein
MSELYHILQSDPRVQDAVIALGDQDEEVHWAVAAKQLGADGKKHKVYLALTHREYQICIRSCCSTFVWRS